VSVDGIRSLGSVDPRAAYASQIGQALPGASFADQLNAAVRTVDGMQENRDNLTASMVRGDQLEVHDVMIAAQEAQLAFELLLEVRNKLLESYQEIMRMQV
jgi:flagellar hook-basal body complex protein FliE